MLHGEGESLTPRAADVPIVLRLLPDHDRLADLLRLFLLAVDIAETDARGALAPLSLERAESLGLIARTGPRVRSRVRIVPASDLLFACDLALESDPHLPPDHVMGVSSSSILLASITVRRPVRDALDVGCGGGLQSVLAAPHAKRVVACDINDRGLVFTAFNAALNGATNIECRRGSFFEPVSDQRFDLIVSNPPFVVSPDAALAFRDSGMRGDDVSRLVVRQTAAHLSEGGLGFVLVSWGVREGEDWSDPLRAWVGDLDCDAWFLHHSRATPLGYAATWNEPLRSAAPGEYEAALDRWVRYYDELGYTSIGYGAVIVRKRTARSHWMRADDIHAQRAPASGAQIAELIDAEDFLARSDDAALLDARFSVVPEHRLDQALRMREGAFAVDAATLRLERGLRFETPIDAFTADLLTRFDGRTTLRAAAATAARRFADEDVAPRDYVLEAAAIARSLLRMGFVRLNA